MTPPHAEFENSAEVKLKAQDSQDLEVISALLQDGLVASADMFFDRQAGSFVMLVNRFCWEQSHDGQTYRCLCGVNIGHVRAVSHRNLAVSAPNDASQFYNLLALSYDQAQEQLTLIFSNEGEIRCKIDRLDVRIKDVAAPHPTMKTPEHPAENKQ